MGMKPRLNDPPKQLSPTVVTAPKSVPEHSTITGAVTSTKEVPNQKIGDETTSPKA